MTATATRPTSSRRRTYTDEERQAKQERVRGYAARVKVAEGDPAMVARARALPHRLRLSSEEPYSLRNLLLLPFQAEERGMVLTQVAGFHEWREHGRSVKKGEHGLVVFAPHTFEDGDGEAHQGFHTTVLFDLSQTEPTEERDARKAQEAVAAR